MLLFILFLLPFITYAANNCPPGYHVSKTYINNTVECSECPDGSYTELPNTIPKCIRCSICYHPEQTETACTKSNNAKCKCKTGYYRDNYGACSQCSDCKPSEMVAVECASSQNTICKCKEGYYNKNGVCIKCSNCYLGEGVLAPCTNVTDVTCEICTEGTFSDKISNADVCNPYTVCILGLAGLNFNVTWFNTVCINCSVIGSLVDIETFFTLNFILQRRFPEEDLKNIFRLTYNKTRNDVDYVDRDNIENSFSYDPRLPYIMQKTDYLTTSEFLADAYNKLMHLCDLEGN
ncbi:tumor necrosis factor receptor protein [Lymphocystis disease virus 3]|uniref:Tumor necrosis factor receptor protein n=1 Tax=Lymphocystis disease virus 3 TaxID=2560566 RepID=A0A1B2RVZ8_9VIRU|nr:tumor necrosis factor receptor protein [Lymphocystis disease virus Sa]AOC55169.1 tumor necrosis factor receptor protein [Lymphocystis disease virus 3]